MIKRPANNNALKTTWVYGTNTDTKGRIKSLRRDWSRARMSKYWDYSLIFDAVMDMSIVKVILALKDLEIYLQVPPGVDVAGRTLEDLSARTRTIWVLQLHNNL